MRILTIHHETAFHHGKAAALSWQMLRLEPRAEANQEVLDFTLSVTPAARDLTKRRDYFGNTVHRFTTQASTEALKIVTTSQVRRQSSVLPPAETIGAASRVRAAADRAIANGDFGLEQYRHHTPAVPLMAGAAQLSDQLSPDLSGLSWIAGLGSVFSAEFIFDPKATSVTTSLPQVLDQRRGVCQDFSHLFISCLRQCGFPAAYVSGYLLTTPPPGKPRLRGVDAMHAWVSIWLPELGWIDYDPTNECFVGEDHVVVARGRDYTDISPIRGLFRGGAQHALTLDLTVEDKDAVPGRIGGPPAI